ncbi:MAG TPA: hypothetical protein VFE41_06470 [Acetobacteraceae bacterium]|jgi:asparagine synthetase B (glutamine-hydrolysing)|nr:hypothetical protein [Acetobacteraceae bacterium]
MGQEVKKQKVPTARWYAELSMMDRFRGEVGVDRVEQHAEQLMEMVNNQEVDKYQLRCAALDLMCASLPLDHRYPKALIRVMKLALELPEKHHIGRWWDDFRTPEGRVKDRRGNPDRPAWEEAANIDGQFYRRYGKMISQRNLQKQLELQLRRDRSPPSTSTLREWRKEPSYRERAGLPDLEPRPAGGAPKRKPRS